MKEFEQLKKDLKDILIDLAVKGEFDGADVTCFDTSKFDSAFRKHKKRLKDDVVVYSMEENHDDPSVYNTPMVRLSTALGKTKNLQP